MHVPALARRVGTLALALMAVLGPAATAHAHDDPAGDTLRRADVAYPGSGTTAPELRRALDGVVAQSRGAGFPVKVALVARPDDLGAFDALFLQPQPYAEALDGELRVLRHGIALKGEIHLLVVTPTAFGGVGLGDGVDAALADVAVRPDGGPNALAQAAMRAVAQIATAAGHPVDVPAEATIAPPAQTSSGEGDGGATTILAFVGPVVLLVLGAIAAGVVTRRRNGGATTPS